MSRHDPERFADLDTMHSVVAATAANFLPPLEPP